MFTRLYVAPLALLAYSAAFCDAALAAGKSCMINGEEFSDTFCTPEGYECDDGKRGRSCTYHNPTPDEHVPAIVIYNNSIGTMREPANPSLPMSQ